MRDSFTWWRLPGFKKASKWPTDYLEARQKYQCVFPHQATQDSVEGIWAELACWRAYKRDEPNLDHDSPIWVSFRESIAKIQDRIIKAVHDGDGLYLKNLLRAATLERKTPKPRIDGIRATIWAFYFLYRHELSSDPNAEWPIWQDVRTEAEKILTEKGYNPSDHQWRNIRKQAGLSGLLSVTKGRARKPKAQRGNSS